MKIRQYLQDLNLPDMVEWVSLREFQQKKTSLVARNGRQDETLTEIDHGVLVEVLVDGQFAYSATNTLSFPAIQAAAEKAVRLAREASKYKIHSFPLSARPKAVGHYRSPFRQAMGSISLKELSDILVAGSAALKTSDKIVNTAVSMTAFERNSRMVSSNGTDIEQETLSICLRLLATASDGKETQTRTNGFPCFQVGMEFLDTKRICEEGREISEQALELLGAEECPSGVFDLVLAPDQLDIQVHESIGHPLELDRILGDEKNYAGWSFVKPNDFGNLIYGSPLLNVTFDPLVPSELASYAFDDIGNTATREYLIKNGILVRGLGSLESQERLKIPGVANMRYSSWNRPPIDRIANVNMEPGETSFKNMISQIENGVYMETNRSWSIDDYRCKFQFSCEYGRRIQNGQLTNTLKNPNYRGTTLPFWKGLKAVGDTDSFKISGVPYCGKGEPNQLIHVGHAVPTCHFKNVEVFGSVF